MLTEYFVYDNLNDEILQNFTLVLCIQKGMIWFIKSCHRSEVLSIDSKTSLVFPGYRSLSVSFCIIYKCRSRTISNSTNHYI